MCVRQRRGQRGEKQAVTWSTTLESLFSTRPLYLVSNIPPGKRKHVSGQSLGNIFLLLPMICMEAAAASCGGHQECEETQDPSWKEVGRGGRQPHPFLPDCAGCQCGHVRRVSSWGTPTLLRESPPNKELCCEFAMGVPALGAFFITVTSQFPQLQNGNDRNLLSPSHGIK